MHLSFHRNLFRLGTHCFRASGELSPCSTLERRFFPPGLVSRACRDRGRVSRPHGQRLVIVDSTPVELLTPERATPVHLLG